MMAGWLVGVNEKLFKSFTKKGQRERTRCFNKNNLMEFVSNCKKIKAIHSYYSSLSKV